MTKSELQTFIEDLIKVRQMLTDAQAIQVPNLFPKIKEDDKGIKKGERFIYDGELYIAREDLVEPKDKIPNYKWKKISRK